MLNSSVYLIYNGKNTYHIVIFEAGLAPQKTGKNTYHIAIFEV